MKNKILVLCLVSLMISLVLVSMASAFSFKDFFDKITGKAAFSINKNNCTDSDSGTNYDVSGNVTMCNRLSCRTYKDSCSGNSKNIIERYCSKNNMATKVYKCPAGCKDGACVSSCTDSDGGWNIFVAGSVTLGNCVDRCGTAEELASSDGKNEIFECFCGNKEASGGGQGSGWAECPNNCSNGACITPSVPRENIIVKNSGDDKMTLEFTDYLGNTKNTQFARSLSSSVIDLQHDSDGHRIIVAERAAANRSDMIVVGNEDEGHLIKVSQIVNQTTGYSQDKVTFADVFTEDTYTATLTAEGTGTVTIGGKVYNVNYFGDSGSSEDARTVRLNYPDSIDTNTMIIHPTIQTNLGAKLAFYKPLITIDTNNWDGSNNKLKTLKIPNGNGYTDVNISTFVSGQIEMIFIANLKYKITRISDIIYISLLSPNVVYTIISDPAIVLIEEKDNNGEFNSIIVTLEAGNTGADGIGVSNVYRTWSNDSVCDEKYQGNNQFKEADFWGAIVTLNATDSDQAKATVSYPDSQVNLDLVNCNF